MKKILGLDLGTTSIGWAVVNEAENENERSSIVKAGVRVVPLTVDEQTAFEKGQSITTTADRTLKRGMRRNLDRYQMRRDHLISLLRKNGIIDDNTPLAEDGKGTTHETWRLRAKAVTDPIALHEFARVLMAINKKRGYKSNRKAKDEDEGQALDGMTVARELYDNDLTPGQYGLRRLQEGKRYIPDFYHSDLQAELDQIWRKQQEYHGVDLLNDALLEKISGKAQKATWAILKEPWGLVGEKRNTKGAEKRLEDYQWRVDALTKKMSLEQLAVVIQQINGAMSSSSGLLGAISDRSKQLMIQDLTVGQYLYAQIKKDPHTSLKNQTFYRLDYLDEFERLWITQSKAHPERLTDQLKAEIRDTVIFYQRRLKSQKGLLSVCEFEGRKEQKLDENGQPELTKDGKPKMHMVGPRVCPKSSPLFQEFRIWQVLNNLVLTYQGKDDGEGHLGNGIDRQGKEWTLGPEYKARLFEELNWRKELSAHQALKLIGLKPKEWKLNHDKLEGNRTHVKYLEAFGQMLAVTGHEQPDFDKMEVADQLDLVHSVLGNLGVNLSFLEFDASLGGKAFEQQPAYALWHLLYSYEGDGSRSGTEKLARKLQKKFGFDAECAKIMAKVGFEDAHGNLSARAIKKILPHLKEGMTYDEACLAAGYNHSHSITAEENENRELLEKLSVLPKNTLRNPVVEKVLNQMIHVVNKVIEVYGRPDEIRVEMAREMKMSGEERKKMTEGIGKATREHDKIRQEIAKLHPFNTGVRITRNDIIKYKLWQELEQNGHKTLYTGTYIPLEELFGKKFDIEHIIPQARLFDDSFSNKTLAVAEVNRKKGNATAMDFMEAQYGAESAEVAQYKERVEKFFKEGSKAKYKKLLMKEADIPDGFIERDLRNTQYITRTAVAMLKQVARTVTPTTGKVTDELRRDWGLMNVLQELNRPKYEMAGLVHQETTKDGRQLTRITDWTKRNDHRHHAMDAITIAFTRPSHIQYLNYLNARKDEGHKKHRNILAIENKETKLDEQGRRYFIPPIPIKAFRDEAKQQLESILVSFKAKNKVTTRNVNKSKKAKGYHRKTELTPRGQLHKETVYGKRKQYTTKVVKVGPSFGPEMIATVADKAYREALKLRLQEAGGDPKKAFGGKNALNKRPLWLDEHQKDHVPEKVAVVEWTDIFTIRKPIAPDLNVDKVIDGRVKRLLQERLDRFGGDPKKAFANLDEDPIWVDRPGGAKLKRVTITGVSTAIPLHIQRDHHGKPILDEEGQEIPADYVQTGNNHHVAIYRDEKGDLQEQVVSFHEAVARRLNNLPIVDRNFNRDKGWQFLFTMKQNEMFVFPDPETGFDPAAIDLKDPANASLIAPHLFRVQKIATKNYMFTHHFETQAIDGTTLKEKKELSGIIYRSIRSTQPLEGCIKVRVDHLGQIAHVGEY